MKLLQGGMASSSTGRSMAGDRNLPESGRGCCNVLFLCADNAVKSLIAEALLKRWGGSEFRAFSAGTQPKSECDPAAAVVLKEQRVWHDGLRSKGCAEYLAADAPAMDFVISLGDQPPAAMPAQWPGNPQLVHWHITEPVLDGTASVRAHSLRKTFLELENRIKLMVLVYQHDAMKSAATAA